MGRAVDRLIGKAQAIWGDAGVNESDKCMILIVDDEPTIARMMSRVLRELPCRLMTAGSAEAALEMLEGELPRLVITDIRMPGMDGVQLTQSIKALYPELPVVLMSAFGEPMARVGDGFIPKPFDNEQLVSTIEAFLATGKWEVRGLRVCYGGEWPVTIWFGDGSSSFGPR